MKTGDEEPACTVAEDHTCDRGDYNNYTVVDRIGTDSFTPDRGVMLAKTKDADASPFVWVVDANPQDINMVDFTRPDGTKAMVTLGDYRQLSDALFHAGTNSGSEYEYVDKANRLHFYILDCNALDCNATPTASCRTRWRSSRSTEMVRTSAAFWSRTPTLPRSAAGHRPAPSR